MFEDVRVPETECEERPNRLNSAVEIPKLFVKPRVPYFCEHCPGLIRVAELYQHASVKEQLEIY